MYVHAGLFHSFHGTMVASVLMKEPLAKSVEWQVASLAVFVTVEEFELVILFVVVLRYVMNKVYSFRNWNIMRHRTNFLGEGCCHIRYFMLFCFSLQNDLTSDFISHPSMQTFSVMQQSYAMPNDSTYFTNSNLTFNSWNLTNYYLMFCDTYMPMLLTFLASHELACIAFER